MQKTKKYNWIVYYQKTEWCKTWIKEVDKETFYNAIDKELKSYANY